MGVLLLATVSLGIAGAAVLVRLSWLAGARAWLDQPVTQRPFAACVALWLGSLGGATALAQHLGGLALQLYDESGLLLPRVTQTALGLCAFCGSPPGVALCVGLGGFSLALASRERTRRMAVTFALGAATLAAGLAALHSAFLLPGTTVHLGFGPYEQPAYGPYPFNLWPMAARSTPILLVVSGGLLLALALTTALWVTSQVALLVVEVQRWTYQEGERAVGFSFLPVGLAAWSGHALGEVFASGLREARSLTFLPLPIVGAFTLGGAALVASAAWHLRRARHTEDEG
ncbi:MAG: hypothetical protein AB7N76_27795 [Planctomycetota bacterium]